MKITVILIVVVIILECGLVGAASQNVDWPLILNIKSGDHKLIFGQTSTPTQHNYTQPYNTTGIADAGSGVPNVVIGLAMMSVDLTTNPINFQVLINKTAIQTTQFIATLIIDSNNLFSLLYYMYFVIDSNFKYIFLLSYSFDTAGNFTSGSSNSVTYTKSINQTISNYASCVIASFITSFSILSAIQYSIDVNTVMTNANTIAITVSSNSTLSRVEIMMILVDKTNLEKQASFFVNYGVTRYWNSGNTSSTSFAPLTFNYYNFIAGITSLRISASVAINFYANGLNQLTTSTSYLHLAYSSIIIINRQCINTSRPYYCSNTLKCYDICPPGYGNDTTYFYCTACSYTCLTCMGNGISCITCNSNYTRTFDSANKACPCDNGFFDQGYAGCSMCNYTCTTCTNASTICTSCSSTRTLLNNSCPCKTGSFDTLLNNQTCSLCQYSCLTCANISTNCTSCDNTTHRIFDTANKKCPCGSGYADNVSSLCISSIVCSLPCMSCVNNPSTCDSCNSSEHRVLVSNSCPCQSGYSSASSIGICNQTCGNGQMINGTTKQCDDGNSVSGDGCSNSCIFESGYICLSNSSRNPASICIFTNGYLITLVSLIKDDSSNTMTASIQINPAPPSSTIPSLLNLKDYLSINSYSLNNNLMTLNLQINQEVDSGSTLQVGFSTISTTSILSMKTNNLLLIKPYNPAYFIIYKIQTIMVWIYIALLWIGSLLFLIFVDLDSFSGIVQLFMYSSLAWIAVEGQSTFPLLYHPLRNFRYIFGYNISFGSQSCMFQILNVGFILNILPVLSFLTIALITKKRPDLISIKIKRFILFDITYGWTVINCFLVMYGLSLFINSNNTTTISIVSLICGIIYLLLLIMLSYRFFYTNQYSNEVNPKMEITKKNIYKPKSVPIYMLSMLILSFIYLSVKSKTIVHSLIMIGSFFVLFIVFGFANIFINKARYMINLVSLIFVYACMLLINTVPSADWAGFVLLILMYIQIFVNFIFLYFERSPSKITDLSQLSQTQRRNLQAENELREQMSVLQNAVIVKDESNIEKHYSQFTVYEPLKKAEPAMQIIIPSPRAMNSMNNNVTPIKNAISDGDIDKSIEMRGPLNQFLLTSPKINLQLIKQQEFIDIANRKVDMSEI